LLDASPLPWTRMRQLGMLHGLIKRFGPHRVDETGSARPSSRIAPRPGALE
jgi:hypothetical protein